MDIYFDFRHYILRNSTILKEFLVYPSAHPVVGRASSLDKVSDKENQFENIIIGQQIKEIS